ncbi:DUF1294 domain-containing protein [Achromobacter sp. NPDC058515]|uniref:DUF1294 domain-containing protein n=1 Tax=Achromobacter sp. NPDC058515 TaxID=3346533 RepID=UPI003647432E
MATARFERQLLLIPIFLCICLLAWFNWGMPVQVGMAYLALSAAAFAAYAIDKAAARADRRRISEKTLHLLSLAGGWPGALIAQQWLRHKTVKVEFRLVFWATVALNIAAFLLLCSPAGRSLAPMWRAG